MTDELLPCPFCGCTAIYVTHTHYYDDEDTVCVFCNGCKAHVILEQNEAEGINEKTKAEAIDAWNTRAPVEYDGWFYLPKPKQQLFSYTDGFSFDALSVKATGTVDVYAITSAVQKWQEEALNKQIIDRICEVFKPERTCRNVDEEFPFFECSECGCHAVVGYSISGDGELRFCPNCGAKVVEE